ncbi:MAG: class I SAM-dependent methyltransferase [Phycicoccus sp.]|nr:class I SAM-dependent methyltransferase [Phycicoccus sp.]
MDQSTDTNADIWKSQEGVQFWTAKTAEREQKRATHWRFLGELLPFDEQDVFTFLDLGAGTGAAARGILDLYPRSTAILTDFSAQMMSEGQREMQDYEGRFEYVEFDMSTSSWPAAIPAMLDAVVTSMCIHHLPDDRKQGLFAEILAHLAPGGWYVNYDPVSSADPVVEATWERVNDRDDPEAAGKRLHRTPQEQHRFENHVRYVIPLDRQLDYLRSAGFQGVDVYWKHLENVIYGGRRPA